ncbi:MAG: PDZ domain-containing protein, partial [Gemmatimonadota bacterium]|nr:PDZ domain-containing protein [Gemmatimonadota bacterium]
EKKSIKVKLAEAPADEPRRVATNAPRQEDAPSTTAAVSKIGVSVEALTPRVIEARRIADKLKGVIVNDVTPGSPAEGKLLPLDVISEVRILSGSIVTKVPVATVADLQRELAKVKAGQYVSLLVYSTGNGRDGLVANSRVVNLRVAE